MFKTVKNKRKQKIRKIIVLMVALLLLLTACDFIGRKPESTPEPTPSAPTIHTIKFNNDTAYNFNRIYISPTASEMWGDELLGSTSILKARGNVEVTIPAYDFNNYDIQILDEDNDEYVFMYVTLQDGYTVSINFGDEGLAANIYDHLGIMVSTVFGTINSNDMQNDGFLISTTGYDTNGFYSFTIYNESDYELYAIYVGPSDGDPEDDIDILPERVPGGNRYVVEGSPPEDLWAVTEWTFFVEDMDDDTSASYEVFNLWALNYVNITWDNAAGGYVAEFVY